MLKNVIVLLILVESGGNDTAVSEDGQAVGCLRIQPDRVKECNRLLRRPRFFRNRDRAQRQKPYEMAYCFLSHQLSIYQGIYAEDPDALTLACSWRTGDILKEKPADYMERIMAVVTKEG